MKKFTSLILSLLLVCNLSPVSMADGEVFGELFIVYPADGSVISCDQNTFEASIPGEKNPTNTFFYLDGKYIGDGGPSAAITTEDILSIGDHTLELRAVYDDGTGDKAISHFSTALKQYVMDFEQYSPKVYESKNDVNQELTCLYEVNSALFNYGTIEVANDYQKGRILRINKTKGSTLYAGNGSFFVPVLGQKSNMSQVKEGRLVVEFDFSFQMAPNWATVLNICPFSRNGHGNFGINLVHNLGVVPGTNMTISDTEWHHTKIIFDLDTGRYNAWIDDTDIPEGAIIFPDSALERDYYYYRIGVALSRADDGVNFDNIKVGKDGAMDDFYGISDVDFVNANGDIITESDIITRDVQKLLIKTERSLNVDSISSSAIEVMLAGKTVSITEALLSEDGKTITVTLDNPASIEGNGECAIILSDKIQFSEGGAIGNKSYKKLEIEPSGFYVESVEFQKTGNYLFAASMLREGDVVEATVDFVNLTESSQTLTALLVIKDGDKYISLSAKDVVVDTTDETGYNVTISSPEIPNISDPEVYLMFVDDLNNGLYIDSYDLP